MLGICKLFSNVFTEELNKIVVYQPPLMYHTKYWRVLVKKGGLQKKSFLLQTFFLLFN